jgi:hypothetical protein
MSTMNLDLTPKQMSAIKTAFESCMKGSNVWGVHTTNAALSVLANARFNFVAEWGNGDKKETVKHVTGILPRYFDKTVQAEVGTKKELARYKAMLLKSPKELHRLLAYLVGQLANRANGWQVGLMADLAQRLIDNGIALPDVLTHIEEDGSTEFSEAQLRQSLDAAKKAGKGNAERIQADPLLRLYYKIDAAAPKEKGAEETAIQFLID